MSRLMSLLFGLVITFGLLAAPGVSAAQVSETMAEAAVDRHVAIEMNNGSSYRGWMMRTGNGTAIIRVSSGRVVELALEQISTMFVDEPSDARLDRDPSAPRYVSEAEYEFAQAEYNEARRLRFAGIMTAAVGGVALAAGIGTHRAYQNSYCYDGFYEDYRCNQGKRAASITLFTVFPLLIGGGMTMAIKGGKRKNEHAPTLRAYARQQQRERQRTFGRGSNISPSRPSAEFAVSPTFSRGGGGLRLHVSF